MRNDEIEEGRIAEHARGLGTVTREMVVKRARELAMINGRSPDQMLQSDFDQAKRELTGRSEVQEEPESPRPRSHAELRETVRGSHGHRAKTIAAHDEQTDPERLVEEGVQDAEHDQMVEGTRESLRREKQ
jgi:hypothetical protein